MCPTYAKSAAHGLRLGDDRYSYLLVCGRWIAGASASLVLVISSVKLTAKVVSQFPERREKILDGRLILESAKRIFNVGTKVLGTELGTRRAGAVGVLRVGGTASRGTAGGRLADLHNDLVAFKLQNRAVRGTEFLGGFDEIGKVAESDVGEAERELV